MPQRAKENKLKSKILQNYCLPQWTHSEHKAILVRLAPDLYSIWDNERSIVRNAYGHENYILCVRERGFEFGLDLFGSNKKASKCERQLKCGALVEIVLKIVQIKKNY